MRIITEARRLILALRIRWISFGARHRILVRLVHKIIFNRSAIKHLLAYHIRYIVYRYQHEPTSQQLKIQKKQANEFAYRPLISVIIPVYQVPRYALDDLLASLEQQTYANWQACIVWSDSENLNEWKWLQSRISADQRFKLKRLSKNGGISCNSNAAMELATGAYIALLDHDDLLTAWAFFEVVKLLQNTPELDFIYSDRDVITANGLFRLFYFLKPGWGREMLYSVNYLTHLNIIRTQLVREVGGWRSVTDGAQDWDLFLRISERTKNIAHLPVILYHWRMLPGSCAHTATAKPYVPQAQLTTLQDAFSRQGLDPVITPAGVRFHIQWLVKSRSTDIVIFQTGTLTHLIEVIEQVCSQQSILINRIIVVHTTLADDRLEIFKYMWGNRYITIHCQHVTWRSALMAIPATGSADTTLLIDSCIDKLSDNLLQELSGWIVNYPEIAWVSAIALANNGVIYYEAGRVVGKDYQSAPLFFGSTGDGSCMGAPDWYRNASAASSYAIAMRTTDIHAASAITNAQDERTAFTQFCLDLTASGRRGLINPFARIYFDQPPEHAWPNQGRQYHDDPYFHPAFKQVSPFRLQ